jgi:hypothetical protein
MKNKLKISTAVIFAALGTSLLSVGVFAAGDNSDLLPSWLKEILFLLGPSGVCATDYINSRVQLALFLVLGGLVLISVVYALLAAFKYIRSEGMPDKMEEAQKSIKAIFFGIAAMIIAIIGIVLVFVIFGSRPTNPQLYQTCLNAPQSAGCTACKADTTQKLCDDCEAAYKQVCSDNRGKSVTFADISSSLPPDCK